MEHKNLINTLTEKRIFTYFKNIKGIDDHYAHSKLEMGKRLLADSKLEPETTIMIGDTTHDKEVADGMGIECVLVSNGHQSDERLLTATPNVISNLLELKKFL